MTNFTTRSNSSYTFFCKTISENHTGLDSCSWLQTSAEKQKIFFANLDAAQLETRAIVWTTEETVHEIRSKLNDPSLSETAQCALNQIQQMLREGRLVVYQASQEHAGRRSFADPTFLARLLENRVDTPVALITQDKALAADVMKLNDFQSVRGRRILVFRVNGGGYLANFTLLRDSSGNYVPPQSTGLYASPSAAQAAANNTPIPREELHAQDTLWGESGTAYRLGNEINNGAESSIFLVEGHPGLVVKAFAAPSERKAAKCKLLRNSRFPCAEAIMPNDLVYDQNGNFRGYVMQRIDGVELERLFTQRGRMMKAPAWTRVEYIHLAYRLAQTMANFSLGGLLICDVNPCNILVGFNASGVLDPDKLFFIDLDSAQFGTDATGVYPSDGITPEYASPEYLRGGVDDNCLRKPAHVVYSAALLCLQSAMTGIHPFRRCAENSSTGSVRQAIAQGAFPYASGTDAKRAVAPSGAELLWSNMSSDVKSFFHHLFQSGGRYNAVENRPSFATLTKTLKNYLLWVNKPVNQQRYPEITSLEPTRLKPFYATCSHRDCPHPEETFIVTRFRSDGRYFCPDCLSRIHSARSVAAAPVSTAPLPQPAAPAQAVSPASHAQPTAAAASAPAAQQQPQSALSQRHSFTRQFLKWLTT